LWLKEKALAGSNHSEGVGVDFPRYVTEADGPRFPVLEEEMSQRSPMSDKYTNMASKSRY